MSLGCLGLDVKTEQMNWRPLEVVEWKEVNFVTKACFCFIDLLFPTNACKDPWAGHILGGEKEKLLKAKRNSSCFSNVEIFKAFWYFRGTTRHFHCDLSEPWTWPLPLLTQKTAMSWSEGLLYLNWLCSYQIPETGCRVLTFQYLPQLGWFLTVVSIWRESAFHLNS